MWAIIVFNLPSIVDGDLQIVPIFKFWSLTQMWTNWAVAVIMQLFIFIEGICNFSTEAHRQIFYCFGDILLNKLAQYNFYDIF